MKRIVGFATGTVLIAAIAFLFLILANNPENRIVGKWTDASTNYSFRFTEEGKVYFPVEYFNLGFGFEGDIDGTYVIDKKDDKIIFNFNFYTNNYSKTYDFKIKGDALTLTNEATGKSVVFTKQDTAVN